MAEENTYLAETRIGCIKTMIVSGMTRVGKTNRAMCKQTRTTDYTTISTTAPAAGLRLASIAPPAAAAIEIKITKSKRTHRTITTDRRTERNESRDRNRNANAKDNVKDYLCLASMEIGKWRRNRQQSNMRNNRWCCPLGVVAKSVWLLLVLLLANHKSYTTATGIETGSVYKYSQPLTKESRMDDEDSFRPFIPTDISPEYISRNVFTEDGQYRVFQPVESDLRAAITRGQQLTPNDITMTSGAGVMPRATEHARPTRVYNKRSSSGPVRGTEGLNEIGSAAKAPAMPDKSPPTAAVATKGLDELLSEYVENFFGLGQYQPTSELVNALQLNYTNSPVSTQSHTRTLRHAVNGGVGKGEVNISLARATETGRLLFFAGLKKVMWPIYMGLQILKSLLFAMFLPTIIGSVGKILGKGIISGSAPLFIRPMEAPQELDFKDNTFNFDDDQNQFIMTDEATKDSSYTYQPAASQIQNQYATQLNQLSRYGMTEQQKMQDSYMSALQSISSASFKNSNSISGSSSGGAGGGGGGGFPTSIRNKPAAPANMNTFQTFQKVPASSLLLSNYDPFYSPLLSRLDSVFAQLKLNSEREDCREKLICLMYANPAKYAPYSNLVSAQLSRELNELRKPTSDNPDILRFFKYMRAAKDGQDGVDCEQTFDKCKEFKDFENPAMVSTYHDINKLVQARKMT